MSRIEKRYKGRKLLTVLLLAVLLIMTTGYTGVASLIGVGPATVYGAENKKSAFVLVSDDADLFTFSEYEALQEAGEKLYALTGWAVMIVTTDDAEGKEAEEYIEDYYMTYFMQDDGVGLLIDMDNREIRIATSGISIRYLPDDRIDDILDAAFDEVADGNYAGCMHAMLKGIQKAYKNGIPTDQYTQYTDTGEIISYEAPKEITLMEVLIALAVALGVGGGFAGIVFAKYRMKTGRYKFDLKSNSDIHLWENEDRFIREMVTKRHIPKNPPSGGGGGSSFGGSRSSVHHGSGGHTFGGGGRKF